MDPKFAPPAGGQPGGPGGPGGPGPFAARLSPEWTLDFLAPSGVPQKKLHIDVDNMTGVIETEHGSQPMRELEFKDGRLTFKAMLGSNGDENFIVELKLYMGGVMLGEAYMEGDGKPRSPLAAKVVGELTGPGSEGGPGPKLP